MGKQKLLFTGASGFLGTNIYHILAEEYDINTIGLTDSDNYNIDLSKEVPDLRSYFDIILHAAGKAHYVAKTGEEKQLFFEINETGTKNLCRALEGSKLPKVFVFISSVAVYGLESGENISEDQPLIGTTPYARSKINAESFLQDWCSKQNVTLGIIRPSLIAGKNPPGNLGSMIKGIRSGAYLSIGDGNARKSIIMADDIARIIPKLSETGGIYNLCDDHHPSFRELETLIANQIGKNRPWSIPYWCAKSLAVIGDHIGKGFPINTMVLDKIVKPLTFSNKKAKRDLDWQPLSVLNNFLIE
jgi:GlcNAc-P-P-Und epimerase